MQSAVNLHLQKKMSNKKCIVRGNKSKRSTRVASYDKQPYFPGLWAREEKREEDDRKTGEGNSWDFHQHHHVSVVLFQSLVKLLQGLCVSPEMNWILQVLICTFSP